MPAELERGLCPVCRFPVDPADREICARCGAAHHAECLRYAGRCAVFGCEPGPAAPVKKPLPHRREIPIHEQVARCMAHASPVFGLVALIVILELNSTCTTLPAVRQTTGRTKSAGAAGASAGIAPPSFRSRPSTPAVAASRRPPAPPRPAFACPAASPYDERWHPWTREALERVVLSDPKVVAEHARMLRGGERRFLGMCFEHSGSIAYLCYGSPADRTSGCEQRVVVVMCLDQTGRTRPTVSLVESTAISGAAATGPRGEPGAVPSSSPRAGTTGTERQIRKDGGSFIRRPSRWQPRQLVAPETLLSP